MATAVTEKRSHRVPRLKEEEVPAQGQAATDNARTVRSREKFEEAKRLIEERLDDGQWHSSNETTGSSGTRSPRACMAGSRPPSGSSTGA